MAFSNEPTPVPWTLVKGTERAYQLTFTEPGGSPTPLAGASIAFRVEGNGLSLLLDNAGTGAIVPDPGGAPGVAIMTILPAHTAGLAPGSYRYYLAISVPGHGPYPEAAGPFTLVELP